MCLLCVCSNILVVLLSNHNSLNAIYKNCVFRSLTTKVTKNYRSDKSEAVKIKNIAVIPDLYGVGEANIKNVIPRLAIGKAMGIYLIQTEKLFSHRL